MKTEPIYKTKSLEVYNDFLIYKKSRRQKKIVLYDDISNFTATSMKEQNYEEYTLNIYDGEWNYIKLSNFNYNNDEIIKFIHKTISPIALPKLLKRFENNEDIKLGLITINKREGIVKTNNIVRTIPWKNIQRFIYSLQISTIGQAKILFNINNKDELFLYDFQQGNLKNHLFMTNVFTTMIGEDKVFQK